MSDNRVSITLISDNYFFSSKDVWNLAGPKSSAFQRELSHQPNIRQTYVVMGENNCYYIEYRNAKGEIWNTTALGDTYRGLDRYLKKLKDFPEFVSLGTDGDYFCRSSEGNAWCLADKAVEHIGLEDNPDDPVEKVWLGYDGTYISQRASGASRWSLKGHYGSLNNTIKYSDCKVAALGLNLENGLGYFLALEDGKVYCNPGGCEIEKNTFHNWVKATFR